MRTDEQADDLPVIEIETPVYAALEAVSDQLPAIVRECANVLWQHLRLARFRKRDEAGNITYVDKQFFTHDVEETLANIVARLLVAGATGQHWDSVQTIVLNELAGRRKPWNPELDNDSRFTLDEKLKDYTDSRTVLTAAQIQAATEKQIDRNGLVHAADSYSAELVPLVTGDEPAAPPAIRQRQGRDFRCMIIIEEREILFARKLIATSDNLTLPRKPITAFVML